MLCDAVQKQCPRRETENETEMEVETLVNSGAGPMGVKIHNA